jgi:hypothetical protein
MKLIRCNSGHFFDQEKFTVCPYCNGGDTTSDSITEAFSNPVSEQNQNEPIGEYDGVTVQKTESSIPQSLEQALSQVEPTLPLDRAKLLNTDMGGQNTVNMDPNIQQGFGHIENAGSGMEGINPMRPEPNIPPVEPMRMVSPTFPGNDWEDNDYTQAITPGGRVMGSSGQKPVVGWLICLSGKHIGRDFRLVQGKNYIGRDVSMDVCLEGEKTVSRDKHALLVYEPKHHLYLIQSGESKELTYVNDQVVLESKELKAYDEILLGEVKLLFIPLCNEEFNWTAVLEGKGEEKINENE